MTGNILSIKWIMLLISPYKPLLSVVIGIASWRGDFNEFPQQRAKVFMEPDKYYLLIESRHAKTKAQIS